jgi:hypothetical protein
MAVSEDHSRIRSGKPTTHYDGVVRIPGFGDAPERCRDLKPVGFCEHGHTVLGRSSCGTRYCPDHWRDWIEDAVISAVARVAAYRQARDGAERRLVHAVASPPQDRRYSVRSLWDARSEAYEAFEAAGVRGGVTVAHPYRTNDRGEAIFRAAAESGELDDGTGRWRFLRETADGWDDLGRYIEAAPHYHSLAAAEDVNGEAAPDGWVVKNIRSLANFHIHDTESYRDMAASFYYVLTHGAVQDGRQMTTYFGEVHPAAFDPEEELTVTEWDRIQTEAERAVKGTEEAVEGDGGAGPEECPTDDCEAVVRDLMHLDEYLDDDDWVSSVRVRTDGPARLATLRGVRVFWSGLTDRPPPSARSSKGRFRRWLKERGQLRAPGAGRGPDQSQQIGLSEAVMEG